MGLEAKKDLKNGNSILFRSFKVPAKNSSWGEVYKFLKVFIQGLRVSNRELAQILLASEEIFSNISKYAYPKEEGSIELTVKYDKSLKELKVHFEDEGIPFNSCFSKNPDVLESPKDRKIGGLGLYIVHQIVDSIKYENIEGRNNLTISKKINYEEE